MISPTQTMENTTFDFTPSFKNPDDMPEYVSIYDRPKRGRGRPKTCTLTDEEKNREIAKQINVAITITIRITFLQKRNYKQSKQESTK